MMITLWSAPETGCWTLRPSPPISSLDPGAGVRAVVSCYGTWSLGCSGLEGRSDDFVRRKDDWCTVTELCPAMKDAEWTMLDEACWK